MTFLLFWFIPTILVFILLITLRLFTTCEETFAGTFPDNFPRIIDFIWIGILSIVPIGNFIVLIVLLISFIFDFHQFKWKDNKITRFLRKQFINLTS